MFVDYVLSNVRVKGIDLLYHSLSLVRTFIISHIFFSITFLLHSSVINDCFNQQPEDQKEETPATKPIVGIIYPPPEVRNIVDKTASFVARFDMDTSQV